MKQMDECLDRFFEGKHSLKRKWQAHKGEFGNCNDALLLFHYQHLVLAYDVENKTSLYQWYEVPADKRGLKAALDYLSKI